MRLFRDEYPSVIPFIVSHTMKDLEKVSHGSNKPVTTVCSAGHTQESQFKLLGRSVAAGHSFCRTCSSRRLFSERPELLPFYRGDAPAETVTAMSTEPVRWEDSEGIHWMSPNHVTRGGARFALDQGLLRPLTLADAHPTAAQWWSTANTGRPEDYSPRSHVEVSWKCPDAGHTYAAPVYAWARSEGCPVCAGKTVGSGGANSVATEAPWMADRWSEHNTTSPQKCHARAHEVVTLQHPDGWEYRTAMADEFLRGGPLEPGSTLETAVYSALAESVGLRFLRCDRYVVPRSELDIWSPEKRVAIEVNGVYWHSSEAGKQSTYHYDKTVKCRDAGIRLIHVWEDEWSSRPHAVLSYLGQALNEPDGREYEVSDIPDDEGRRFVRDNRPGAVPRQTRFLAARSVTGEVMAVLALGIREGVPRARAFCCAGRPVPGALRDLMRAAGPGAVYAADEGLAEGQLAAASGLTCVRPARRPRMRVRKDPESATPRTTYDSGSSDWTLPES